jgi:DNA-binding NarL/FixJ family response regulator
MFRRARELGALGYILKDGALSEIVRGLDSALRGDFYCSAPLNAYTQPRSGDDDDASGLVSGLTQLTPAELRVLLLIAENRTTEEIAEALCVSPRTVEGHRAHIGRKLGLNGTHSLLRFALMHRSRLPVSPHPLRRGGNATN